MRIPAVALAVAFSGGILLGRELHLTHGVLGISFLGIFFLLIAALVFARRDALWSAAILCLFGWVGLGAIGMVVASRPLPAKHVLSRIAAGQIELKTPLRWYGHLRSDPARLPWSVGLEMELSGVETAEGMIPISGGMRMGFTPKEGEAALPEIHAGDEMSVLAQARLPLVFRDAGAFDRREYLAQQNIHLLATLRASSLLERISTTPATMGTRLARLRALLRERLDTLYPDAPQTAGILRAMLLGDRSFVDQVESVDFQKTGVFHVLVVAGLHVGALAFFLFWLGNRLRLPRTLATVLLLAALFAYIAVVEQRAPVLRAGMMTGIIVMASFIYRRLEILNSAAVAALALLVAKPSSAFDTSFQLSFLAIGCIAGVAVPWMERHVQPYVGALGGWRDVTRDGAFSARQAQFRLDLRAAVATMTRRLSARKAKWAQDFGVRGLGWSLRGAEMLALSVVLQFGMLPLMARDFHRVTVMGPLANLFAVPLTGVIVPMGFFTLGSAVIVPPIARVLAWPLGWLVGLQGHVVGWFAGFAHGSYRIPGPPVWVTILFFACGILLAMSLRAEGDSGRRVKWTAVAGLMLASLVIGTHPFPAAVERGALEVDVLDVAQGDSILVISPKGSTLLIDGGGRFAGFRGHEEVPGPDPGEEAVSAYLWSRGIQRLDAVALTHAHQDHIGGLKAVLENFQVGRLWLGRETETPALGQLKQIAERRHVRIEHELRGQSFLWDGVQVDFLWPQIPPEEIAPIAKNNDSLVVRLQYKERSVLLPGDAEKQAEYAMLSETDAEKLHADVLKVGHHGSKNSTMPEFLESVGPQIAVISAGEQNPYGHPSAELLERLRESGARILRTDQEGAVQVVTDGHSLRVNCFVGCGGELSQVSRNR
ncbi:MAG TPA: DNA internalization-related competence protein ComEC/Rec2 [Candidatus Acidoferrales bacterium]|nr:DNA internalization-related competence protein ComEC/Rec2 [Candidatus Acidoferrales bacterium]